MSRDTIIAIGLIGFAGLYWLGADAIRVSPLEGPIGAQAVPKSLAIALAVLSVLLIAQDLWRRRTARAAAGAAGTGSESRSEQRRKHLRAAGMLAIGIGYVAVIETIGYIPAIALLLLATALYLGRTLSPRLVLLAVAGSVVYYAIFVLFLGIPLPAGIWPELWRGMTGG